MKPHVESNSAGSPIWFGGDDFDSTIRALVPSGLLFVRDQLDDLGPEQWRGLLRDLYGPGDLSLRLANLHLVLPLLHEARSKDEKTFFNKLFLPWVGLRRRLDVNRNRILDEFARASSHTPGTTDDLAHLVNIYRNLVADLLDPYLTLLVASYQFVEGTFVDIETANFGRGERNKDEYLSARIKAQDPETRLLSGYDPVVRNAVSHSGSHGVTYEPNAVLFRSIKRGAEPKVEVVHWTEEELLTKILRLFECILSIDAAIGVFGLDVSEKLAKDWDVLMQTMHFTTSAEQRAEMRASAEQAMASIRDNAELTQEERFKQLSKAFFQNCGLRQMPVIAVKRGVAQRLIVIVVPTVTIDLLNDEQVVNRTMLLSRYAIVAEAVYGQCAETYVVAEDDGSGNEQLKASFAGALLHEYAEERAGIYDLVHESTVLGAGKPFEIAIDFKAVEKREQESIGETFPRRKR